MPDNSAIKINILFVYQGEKIIKSIDSGQGFIQTRAPSDGFVITPNCSKGIPVFINLKTLSFARKAREEGNRNIITLDTFEDF